MRVSDSGRRFLAYFFVAGDKEVSRHKGETELKLTSNQFETGYTQTRSCV